MTMSEKTIRSENWTILNPNTAIFELPEKSKNLNYVETWEKAKQHAKETRSYWGICYCNGKLHGFYVPV